MLQGMGAKVGLLHAACASVYIWLPLMGAKLAPAQGLYRLVVRMSRCGRDNPGSTPGEDIHDTGAKWWMIWILPDTDWQAWRS